MNGKIYMITNLENGKRYIGQTIQSLQKRKEAHVYTYSQTPLSRAFRKYGKDKFAFYILDENITTIHQLDELEKLYIAAFNTVVPNGYNVRSGGFDGTWPTGFKSGKSARYKYQGFYVHKIAIINPNGVKFITDHFMKFCEYYEFCYYGLQLLKAKRCKSYKGWTVSDDLSGACFSLFSEANNTDVKRKTGAPSMDYSTKQLVMEYKESSLSLRKIAKEVSVKIGKPISYVYIYKVFNEMLIK